MPTEIAGDPAALRAAAAQFRRAGEHAAAATRLVHTSVDAAAGGWHGAAHDAFVDAATSTGGRVAAIERFVGAAVVLESYAHEIEPLQQQYAQAMTAWYAAGGDGVQSLDG